MPRIFQNITLALKTDVRLNEQASHHVARVLRCSVSDTITLFNGQGGEYAGKIIHIDKKYVTVHIIEFIDREAESPLDLYLAQGISRGEKMDYTIQKAIELGVKKIIPLLTERSTIKLDHERREKRLAHWQSIAISACEQCGRNQIPDILMPQSFEKGLSSIKADKGFVLSPHVKNPLAQLTLSTQQSVVLLIGPEGGLTEEEIKYALLNKYYPLNLGPRILRTETAAIAAITALQCYFGDMS